MNFYMFVFVRLTLTEHDEHIIEHVFLFMFIRYENKNVLFTSCLFIENLYQPFTNVELRKRTFMKNTQLSTQKLQ